MRNAHPGRASSGWAAVAEPVGCVFLGEPSPALTAIIP